MPRRGSYESVNSQSAVDMSLDAVPADDEATEALKRFIPLLEFQIDKLFGTVAQPVFYAVAIALLLMNTLTVAFAYFGASLVQEGADLRHAMAGIKETVAFTMLNLLIITWHQLLRKRVQQLVPESFVVKLKRTCCSTTNSNGSTTAALDKWLDGSRRSSGTLRGTGHVRTKSVSVVESALVRTASPLMIRPNITASKAGIYISSSSVHALDLAAAASVKEALLGNKIWTTNDLCAGNYDEWLVESHISEILSASNYFVPLISEELLSSMESAHEEWNGTITEWKRALELHKQGALTIIPAWLGHVDLTSVALDKISEGAPKCGEGSMQSEALFDSRIEERSVRAIVDGMLKLAEDSLRLTKFSPITGNDSTKSLMLSYCVTETGDPKDTLRDAKKKGDNFTPRLQRALQEKGYSCFVAEKQL
eukprot:COSAG02_NODE_9996_length_2054_cov_17.047376_1_plen_422_part_01